MTLALNDTLTLKLPKLGGTQGAECEVRFYSVPTPRGVLLSGDSPRLWVSVTSSRQAALFSRTGMAPMCVQSS